MSSVLRRFLPGIVTLFVGGWIAFMISRYIINISPLVLAVILGAVFANTIGLPDWAKNGVDTHKLWLEVGIVLMGVRIVLDQLFVVGPKVLILVVTIPIFTIIYIELLARNIFHIPNKMGTLLAAGSSICGVSAIVAVSGGIRAKSEQVAYAVATILIFDATTLIVYPIVGQLFNLPDIVFGIWAGVSMFSTGPVVAAGFAYSQKAGQWATITKLSRNILIGLIATAYTIYYARTYDVDNVDSFAAKWRYIWDTFPKFVIGFIGMIIAISLGLISQSEVELIKQIYHWTFFAAFIGLGTTIQIEKMREASIRPVLTVLIALITVSALSLLVSLLLFG